MRNQAENVCLLPSASTSVFEFILVTPQLPSEKVVFDMKQQIIVSEL